MRLADQYGVTPLGIILGMLAIVLVVGGGIGGLLYLGGAFSSPSCQVTRHDGKKVCVVQQQGGGYLYVPVPIYLYGGSFGGVSYGGISSSIYRAPSEPVEEDPVSVGDDG